MREAVSGAWCFAHSKRGGMANSALAGRSNRTAPQDLERNSFCIVEWLLHIRHTVREMMEPPMKRIPFRRVAVRILVLLAIFAILLPLPINDDNGYWQSMAQDILY